MDKATRQLARELIRLADAEGVIQAGQMVDLFPGKPQLHTTRTLPIVLREIGCTEDEIENLLYA